MDAVLEAARNVRNAHGYKFSGDILNHDDSIHSRVFTWNKQTKPRDELQGFMIRNGKQIPMRFTRDKGWHKAVRQANGNKG